MGTVLKDSNIMEICWTRRTKTTTMTMKMTRTKIWKTAKIQVSRKEGLEVLEPKPIHSK